MLTRNGIQLNLKESEYTFTIDNLMFYFSSVFYKEKFISDLPLFISSEVIKLKNKYRIDVDGDLFFAISLYKKIEKRGFYIKNIRTGSCYEESPIFHIV